MKPIVALVFFTLCTPLCLHAAEQPEPETITIRGETYTVVPDEKLRALGLEFANVPPEENAATDYLKAFAVHWFPDDEIKHRALQKALADDHLEHLDPIIKEYLKKNRNTLALTQKATTKKSCHFPFLLDEDDSDKNALCNALITMPWIVDARNLGRLLRAEGWRLEVEGRHEEAIEMHITVCVIGKHVAQEPMLIHKLLGLVYEDMSICAIGSLLANTDLDEPDLVKFQTRLRTFGERRPSLASAMRTEHIFCQLFLEQSLKDPDFLVGLLDGSEAVREAWTRIIQSEVGLTWIKEDMAAFYEHSASMLELPIVRRTRIQFVKGDLRWTVLDIEFALARHKAKHGKYPEKLNDVKPLILSDGIDPFSGELLKYRLEDDGSFTIWSVGDDLTDDGGKGPTTSGDRARLTIDLPAAGG